MNQSYWAAIGTQILYTALGLTVALVLWTVLPESNLARFESNHWRFGGAFAGFVAVQGLLYRYGPIRHANEGARGRVRADVLLNPTQNKEYDRLFKGFGRTTFHAFNPPFKVEGTPGEPRFENALDAHEERYRSNVVSKYLFFDAESHDRAMRFFDALEGRIGKKMRDECIRVRLAESEEPPAYTFFTGDRKGAPACVFYPSGAMRNGLPQAVFLIEGAGGLVGILEQHFDTFWSQERPPRVANTPAAAPTRTESEA